MSDAQLHELVIVAAAAMSALIALGGGAWKAWAHFDRQLGQLKRDIEACKAREADTGRKINLMNVCLRLLIPEVKRAAPTSAALGQVRALLDEEWPLDADTPADMLAQLDRLDGARPHLAAVGGKQ